MRRRQDAGRWAHVAGTIGLLAAVSPVGAQAPEVVRTEFLHWAEKSLHQVTNGDLEVSTKDLRPMKMLIGDAKIVGLSEGQHAAAEPLIFRNRLFKHLVEHLRFDAIAIESGIVEGRVLNDYVTRGKGDIDDVLTQGFSNGFGTFRQNEELIRWIKEYNERLPRDAAKVQIFGLDVPGSPGNFDAARGPDTALRTALDFLRVVDPPAAEKIQQRVETFLPVLKGINGYGDLKETERDSLTAAVADLVSLMERQRHAYAGRSSTDDADWAERTAIGARQTDAWFRQMPVGWKLEDGLEWTRYAMQVRDRSMADNFEWVRRRLEPRARVLVFAATGHLATTIAKAPGAPFREMLPLGAYLEERYGAQYINILNLVANGEIKYCSSNPQRIMTLEPPPESAVETLFAAAKSPRYVLDLRTAPPGVSSWLQQTHDHWNGFGALQFATAKAFDLAYYVSPMTSACKPQ